MSLNVYKFRSIDELALHLIGGVTGGRVTPSVFGLVSKTLIFTKPTSATCTFVAGADPGGLLTFAEIVSQLQSAIANLVVTQKDGKIILKSSNTQGVIITGGTARPLLGLGNSTITGRVYNGPGGAAPYFVQSYATGEFHVLVVME